MDKLISKVKKFIEDEDLLKIGDRIVVGFSGGVDSVALLMVLVKFKAMNLDLYPVYVHHHLRDEADLDVGICRDVCQALGLELIIKHVNVKDGVDAGLGSIEEVARSLRYEVLETLMADLGANKIAVAHHMDDQAETILHRIIRGSGGLGIIGMKAKYGHLIRPLLCVRKDELADFVDKEAYPYVVDQTNFDTDYTRNRIRHKLIPDLKTDYNEKIVESVNRLSEIVKDDEDYMEEEAKLAFENCLLYVKGHQLIKLNISCLQQLHKAIRSRVIRLGIKEIKGDLKNIQWVHTQRVEDLLNSQSGKGFPLVDNLYVRREYNELIIDHVNSELILKPNYPLFLDRIPIKGYIQNANMTISVTMTELSLGQDLAKYKDSFKKTENVYTKWFDYDKIETNLVFRTRIPKDRIELDEDGHSKTIKKYFIDRKIPESERDKILLMTSGHKVIWIVGHRVNANYYVTNQTRRILEVELIKEDDDGKY